MIRAGLLVFILGIWGCGASSNGQCKDYEPLIFGCSDGFEEVCDRSGECVRCSCVSSEDVGPNRPFKR